MQRWWISVVCLFPGMIAGAQTLTLKPAAPVLSVAVKPLPFTLCDTTGFLLKPATLLSASTRKFPTPVPVTAPVYRLAADEYYQQHFGFFCKKEWVWQKQTGVPLKFRLGSYSYAQQQEGKR
ncbi:hypothetical protein [Chitinophaga sp. ARDCPP14]|uniref:hypothetical protein n=1 Tax=Chitinophaga sp. ARDCPP14 TaxID=3391139 RepID=UPI003F51DFE5